MGRRSKTIKQICQTRLNGIVTRACQRALEVANKLPITEADIKRELQWWVDKGELKELRPGVYKPTGGSPERK